MNGLPPTERSSINNSDVGRSYGTGNTGTPHSQAGSSSSSSSSSSPPLQRGGSPHGVLAKALSLMKAGGSSRSTHEDEEGLLKNEANLVPISNKAVTEKSKDASLVALNNAEDHMSELINAEGDRKRELTKKLTKEIAKLHPDEAKIYNLYRMQIIYSHCKRKDNEIKQGNEKQKNEFKIPLKMENLPSSKVPNYKRNQQISELEKIEGLIFFPKNETDYLNLEDGAKVQEARKTMQESIPDQFDFIPKAHIPTS